MLILIQLCKSGGSLFLLGVGDSAGNSGYAVNNFRKNVGLETYAPTDNVSELTARSNDEGWETTIVEWLKGSRLKPSDTGNLESNTLAPARGHGRHDHRALCRRRHRRVPAREYISPNLICAVLYAKEIGAKVIGAVGWGDGYTAKVGDAVSIVQMVDPDAVTPHSEVSRAVIWHLLVIHPPIEIRRTKWEGTR